MIVNGVDIDIQEIKSNSKNNIEAIKKVRELTGAGLKDAKDAVERNVESGKITENNITKPINDFSKNDADKSNHTKVCKFCRINIPKEATICPNCKKKQTGNSTWIGIVILIIFISGIVQSFGDNNKDAEQKSQETKIEETKENEEQNIEEKYENGKISNKNPITIYYMELYENYEDYLGKYVTISAPLSYVKKESVNIKGDIEGITGMITITLLESKEDLSEGDFVTVTGRIDNKALGYLYMKDANILEVGDNPHEIYNQQKEEYDALLAQKTKENKGTSDEKKDNSDTNNTFYVGDILETKEVKLSYLSCGEYSDNNMFVKPGDGNKFVYFEFEFENIGNTDTHVGYFDFDCYADGYEASSVIITADNAMTSIASISPSRKLSGIVVFEVPKNVENIEVEYETNYWTQKKAIFVYE